MHNKFQRKKSFFWNDIIGGLPTFRIGVTLVIKDGATTMIWLDIWVNDCVPKDLWPEIFKISLNTSLSIKDTVEDSQDSLLAIDYLLKNKISRLRSSLFKGDDVKH